MTDLRRWRIDELTIGHYSLKTIPTYVAAVARLAKHFNRSPDCLTPEEIRPFQLVRAESKPDALCHD